MAEMPPPWISWLEHSQKLREAFDYGFRAAMAQIAQAQDAKVTEMAAHVERLETLMASFRQELDLILMGPLADEHMEVGQGFWKEIDPAEEWAAFLAQQMREEEQ